MRIGFITFAMLSLLAAPSARAQVIKQSPPSQLPVEEVVRQRDGAGFVSGVLVTKDGAPKGHVRVEVMIARRGDAPRIYAREVRVRVLTEQGKEIAADAIPKDSQPLIGMSNAGSAYSYYQLQIPGTGADIAKVEVTFAGATHSFTLRP